MAGISDDANKEGLQLKYDIKLFLPGEVCTVNELKIS